MSTSSSPRTPLNCTLTRLLTPLHQSLTPPYGLKRLFIASASFFNASPLPFNASGSTSIIFLHPLTPSRRSLAPLRRHLKLFRLHFAPIR